MMVEAMQHRVSAASTLDDGQLVRRIAAAPASSPDDEAELCRRLATPVRLYGRRHLRDDQAAADLVQEVLVAVIEAVRAGRVEAPDRIRPFVLGTCRFIAWRMRRGEWRREAAAERALLEVSEVIDPAGEAALDAERLERCLGGLPARERKVLYLSFYEDRSAQEIGAALSVAEGNVRVIRHRALARLRACVDQAPPARGGGR
jgi:RNA polymerase sigma-70 factor, ECF subfamily